LNSPKIELKKIAPIFKIVETKNKHEIATSQKKSFKSNNYNELTLKSNFASKNIE